jgi:predicted O-methyltransferase YrrM
MAQPAPPELESRREPEPPLSDRPTFIPLRVEELRRLQAQDYSHLPLTEESEQCRLAVRTVAEDIFHQQWNHYSNALKHEVIHIVQTVASHFVTLGRPVRYLEIGSARGLSMGFVGTLLRALGVPHSLTSLDPYYAEGYFEGARSPVGAGHHVPIDKTVRDGALKLYAELNLDVTLLEAPSTIGLPDLLRKEKTFNWIYVDGSHEGLLPAFDFGLSMALLEKPGVIVLDDPCWHDVAPLRHLADQHLVCLGSCWKLAAYRVG